MQILQEISESVGSYILGVLLSLGIGLIIGLEREYDKLKDEKLYQLHNALVEDIVD